MRKHKISTYPYNIWVTCNTDDLRYFTSQQGNPLKSEDMLSSWDACSACVKRKTTQDIGSLIIIGVSPLVNWHKKGSCGIPYLTSIIAHEACHAISDLFYNMQIKYDVDNDETYAYLISEIVEFCMDYVIYHLEFIDDEKDKNKGTIVCS